MARPRLTVQVVVIPLKLRLKRGVDDDLIDFFDHLPRRHRPQTVKAALRGQVQLDAPTDEAEDDTEFLAGLGF